MRVLLWLARLIQVFVLAPILLAWLALWLALGALGGGVAAFLVGLAFLDAPLGSSPWHWLVIAPLLGIGLTVAFFHWLALSNAELVFGSLTGAGDSHGSAHLMDRRELRGLEEAGGLLIGRNPGTGRLLRYDGPAHLLTLAPTRAGKGVGTVIPNLLTAERSVLVIDPKGENARIAGKAREGFGPLHVLDPFGVSGHPPAALNPLDRLSAESLDLGEDAASLADALVIDPPGAVGDAHWNEEARALLGGLVMFAVAHEDEDRRTLASVREYLTLPPDRWAALLGLMADSDAAGGLVARAANRTLGKAEREAAAVLSTAQRHTHFLDGPRIAAAMARSDFAFADLRRRVTSVFLVLPPNRLDAYGRWLRLLVSQALGEIARAAEMTPKAATGGGGASEGSEGAQGAPEGHTAVSGPSGARDGPTGAPVPSTASPAPAPPSGPVLFLLDEFAALGRLEAVERAMGLMAGYGLQLWPILQDLSQLRALYGPRASTFVANAGVQQVFGVNDYETAKWLSQSLGRETVQYRTESRRPGDMPTTGTSLTGRDLLTPDEIMQLPSHLQLLRVQGRPPAIALKLRHYADPEFQGLYDRGAPDAR